MWTQKKRNVNIGWECSVNVGQSDFFWGLPSLSNSPTGSASIFLVIVNSCPDHYGDDNVDDYGDDNIDYYGDDNVDDE